MTIKCFIRNYKLEYKLGKAVVSLLAILDPELCAYKPAFCRLQNARHTALVQKPFVHSRIIGVNAEKRIATTGFRSASYSSVKLSRDN